MSAHGFVGDLLIRNGVIDAAGLARANEARSAHPATLGRALASLGLADESVVAVTIAKALHLEHLEGEPPAIGQDVLTLLPKDFCQKRGVVPLGFEGNVLRLAVTDPMDDSVLQDVRFRTGRKTTAVVVTQTWLDRLYLRVYPMEAGPTRTTCSIPSIRPARSNPPTRKSSTSSIPRRWRRTPSCRPSSGW